MDHILHIQLSSSEGAIIRALGLMERRGFTIRKCSVDKSDNGSGNGGLDMDVTVASSRPGDLLKRQLERLHDVLLVELKPAEPVRPQKPGIRPITRRI
jgi:acetolactate synthase II small subunit